jgi:hypothetical protein
MNIEEPEVIQALALPNARLVAVEARKGHLELVLSVVNA